jgi:predicted DNA-binding transcriptional regulator AlpA
LDRAVLLRAKLGLVTQEEFALMLDVSVDTVREWRRLKQGPDFVKTGKGVMYREQDIQEWIRLNVVPVMRRAG